MKKTIINPWQWQDNLGYAQAISVSNSTGTLYCAGQAAMDADGKPSTGNMEEQLALCCSNLQTVIDKAGYNAANIVRLNFYTTDINSFFASYGVAIGWLQQHGCTPASTLIEVSALAFPSLLIEIEATVVQ